MKEIKGELQIDFTGDGFLQGMVRILVGTLVEVGEGNGKRRASCGAGIKEQGESGIHCAAPRIDSCFGKV